MGLWAVSWALESEVPNPTHKLVLIALANFADDRDEAWPHVDTLATLASTSRRTVFRALDALEDAGLITRLRGMTSGGRGGLRRAATVFRLYVPEEMVRRSGRRQTRPERVDERPCGDRCATGGTTNLEKSEKPCEDRGDTSGTTIPWGDTHDTLGVTPVSPLYKEEPPVEPPTQPPYPPEVPTEPMVEESGSVGLESVPAPDCLDEREAWELIRSCLPVEMQPLDRGTASRVAAEVQSRLEAGWTRNAVREVLAGNALPPQVRSLGGLVLHRVREIPTMGAPARPRQDVAPKVPETPSPEWYPAFMVEHAVARLKGLPEASRSTLWWAQRVGSAPSDIRYEDGPLEKVLEERFGLTGKPMDRKEME